jgi:uncharacterized protein YuzE
MKPIRLSAHALGYLGRRGFTFAEVEEAIHNREWEPGERGRLECPMDFPFGKEWNGKFYQTKQVRPIFVEEAAEILVITVYTYFFWGWSEMRITYDAEVDAMSIVFRETPVTTKQVAEGIAIEYDREGLIAGIEVLDAVKRFGGVDTLQKITLEGIAIGKPA